MILSRRFFTFALSLALLPATLFMQAQTAAQPAAQPSFDPAAQAVDIIDPQLAAQIDRIAAQVLDQTGVPSASLAVVQHGKLVYTHAYGSARLASRSARALAAAPSMRYSIGSISKQFAAAAILMLQQEGKLSLDDPVSKFVPGLTRGDQVTIRQILSQTSGYQDYWPEDYLMTPMLKSTTAQQILDVWAKKPLDFEPGTQWQYSNTNYIVAGRIVEVVTGRPLFDFLSERIFRPLGMTSVWDSDQTPLASPDASAYYRHALGPLRPAPNEGAGWGFAAFELAMTAHDLALWDQSLLARTVLSPESYREMFTEVKLKDGKGTHYGLGVFVRDLDGHRSIEHSGEATGFVSDNVVLVDDGAAVVVLTNQDVVQRRLHHLPSGRASRCRLSARCPPKPKLSPFTAVSKRAPSTARCSRQTLATTSLPKPSSTSSRAWPRSASL